MPHKVEISDKTYEDLKGFCNLNDLKMGQFADKLIRDGLMMEMYGDVPFTNYRRAPEIESVPVPDYSLTVPKEEVEAVAMDPPSGLPVGGVFEIIDKETKAHTNEVMEKVEAEHPQTYITSQEGEKEIQKEMLKQLVPDKVVNKIIKRRLK